jgi:hypothetical protein
MDVYLDKTIDDRSPKTLFSRRIALCSAHTVLVSLKDEYFKQMR